MIIHKIIKKDNNTIYLCNQACSITLSKSSYGWRAVTCKNCLKQKHTRERLD